MSFASLEQTQEIYQARWKCGGSIRMRKVRVRLAATRCRRGRHECLRHRRHGNTLDSRHGFLRSAGVVSAAVFLSRITGVVREMIMARLFGAGAVYDAFLLGMRIPEPGAQSVRRGSALRRVRPHFHPISEHQEESAKQPSFRTFWPRR